MRSFIAFVTTTASPVCVTEHGIADFAVVWTYGYNWAAFQRCPTPESACAWILPFVEMSFLLTYPSVPLTLVILLLLVGNWFRTNGDRKTENMLAVTAIAIPATGVAEWAADQLSRLRPWKYDLFIYHFDSVIHQPSFAAGRLVAEHGWLRGVVSVSYELMPISMVAAFAFYNWKRNLEGLRQLLWAFLFNIAFAVPIYLLIPVCGPAFAFPGFPVPPSHVNPALVLIHAAPNGVPSVHMSTALLVLYFLWRSPYRLPAILFAVLTAFSTLGSGQHYGFDLLCAVPYSACIYWLSSVAVRLHKQRQALLQTIAR